MTFTKPTETTMPIFKPGLTASQAHESLQKSLVIVERAQHFALLWFAEIMERGLFRDLGYSSINAYAKQELGFSRGKICDFVRLAGKLEKLPHLKESVARGDVGYTKAREVIKVATPKTEAKWVEVAASSSRKILAGKVAQVKRKALARRQGHPSQLELLADSDGSVEKSARESALACLVDELETGQRDKRRTLADTTCCKEGDCSKVSPQGAVQNSGPHFQINIQKCPTCQQATVQTLAGEKQIPPSAIERLECDAIITQSGHRARTSIPLKTRREVLNRDRHRCQGPGCMHTRFLEVHHIRPVAKGGGNEAANLITLCGACHRGVHEGRITKEWLLQTEPAHCPR